MRQTGSRTIADHLCLVLALCLPAAAASAQPAPGGGTPGAVGPESPAVGPESPGSPDPTGTDDEAGGQGARSAEDDAAATPEAEEAGQPAPADQAAQPVAASPDIAGTDTATMESSGGGYEPDDNPQRHMRLATGDLLTLRANLFEFTFGGLLQVWAVPFLMNDARRSLGAPVDTEGFVLRRARFGVKGSILQHTTFELVWDFVDSRLDSGRISTGRIYEAEIGYRRFEFAELGFGIRRVPFSRSDLAPSWGLQMTDVPFALQDWSGGTAYRSIVPPRSIGATLSGRLPLMRYAIGVYNASGSPNAGPDAAGFIGSARLELVPMGSVTEYQGARLPQDPDYDQPRASVGLGGYLWGDPAGDQAGFTADLAFQWNRVSLEAALFWATFSPADDGFAAPAEVLGDITQLAVHAQLGVFLVPGYLELAARFELWNPSVDAEDAALSALRGALNYYLLGHRVKAQLEYTHRMEAGTAQDDDQLVLGLSLRL